MKAFALGLTTWSVIVIAGVLSPAVATAALVTGIIAGSLAGILALRDRLA